MLDSLRPVADELVAAVTARLLTSLRNWSAAASGRPGPISTGRPCC
ncbi:hypothetical protein NKG94_01970 [Micromonospora sp. M12]